MSLFFRDFTITEINSGQQRLVDVNIAASSGLATKITDGINLVTITQVNGKFGLDVNVVDITLDQSNDSVSIGANGSLVDDTNPLPIKLDKNTIAALTPQIQNIYNVDSHTEQDVSTNDEKRFSPVGGWDLTNERWNISQYSSGKLLVKDTAVNASLDTIYDRLGNGTQKTKIVDPSGFEINSLTDPNSQRALMVAQSSTNFTLSSGNSSSVQVAAFSTFTGVIESILNQQAISLLLKSNTNGTLVVNQYLNINASSLVSSWSYTLTPGQTFSRSLVANGNFFNLTYTNLNGSATGTFEVNTYFGTLPSSTNLGNAPVSIDEVNGTAFSLGQKVGTASLPVVEASPDYLAFAPTTAAINYNYFTNTVAVTGAGTGWFDASKYNSMSFSITSNNGVGVIQFEETNDASNSVGSPWFVTNTSVTPAVATTSFTLLAGQLRTFTGDIKARFIRARLSTATTAQSNCNITLRQAYSNTRGIMTLEGGSLGTVLQVIDVSRANLNVPFSTTDLSTTITASTGSTTITPSFGCSYQLSLNVTAVSGTNPTYDVVVQESLDGGVTFYDSWHFPRIITTGQYYTPLLTFKGNRIRYLQTVGGTTPSFSRIMSRTQSSANPEKAFCQISDRAIDLNTVNSTTATLRMFNASNVQLIVNITSAVVAPVIQLEASDDGGVSWDLIGTSITPALSGGTTRVTVANINAQRVRARVTTAGTTTVPNYILIKGY